MPDPVLTFLAGVPLLAGVPHRRLGRVLQLSTPVRVAAGARLCAEGRPGREAVLITAGRSLVHRDGRPIVVVGEGDLVGEIALRRRTPRTASVTALTPLTGLVFDPRELSELLRLDRRIADRIDATIESRLATARDERARSDNQAVLDIAIDAMRFGPPRAIDGGPRADGPHREPAHLPGAPLGGPFMP